MDLNFLRGPKSHHMPDNIIFNKYLLKEFEWLEKKSQKISNDLNIDLYKLYQIKINNGIIDWRYDKSFLQLFLFYFKLS